jgi:hypothetical protein
VGFLSVRRSSGREDVDARADTTLRVDNFECATPKNSRISLCERWTQLLRYRQKQERKIHYRECNKASWDVHAMASYVRAKRMSVEAERYGNKLTGATTDGP